MPTTHTWHELWRFASPFQHFFYVAFGAVAIFLRRYWQRIRENRAAGWPSANGEVQAAGVRTANGNWVEVQYRYYALQEYRYGKYRHHFRKKATLKISQLPSAAAACRCAIARTIRMCRW